MDRLMIRRLHSYMGLFIAPSVLFFSLTGALQVFSLHEAHGHYRPFDFIEKLSSVHKDQVFAFGNHHEPAADQAADNLGAARQPPAKEEEDNPGLATVLLKAFFCIVGIALALSSALGLWIGLTQTQSRNVAWALIAAGTLVPLALLLA